VFRIVAIKELLEYNETIRHRYFESIAKLSWDEFTKERGASFSSIRNIFVHTLGAIDYWLDFLQNEKHRSEKKFDEYKNYEQVKTYMEHVEKRMGDYLHSSSSKGLKKKYTVTGENHKITKITTEDVLIHVFEEEVHHRGELIALLWQMDIDPPEMGWKGL
jgi:uncharacterized damage-inducible protein DinB